MEHSLTSALFSLCFAAPGPGQWLYFTPSPAWATQEDSSLSAPVPGKEEGGPGPVGALTPGRRWLPCLALPLLPRPAKKEDLCPPRKRRRPGPRAQGLSSRAENLRPDPSGSLRSEKACSGTPICSLGSLKGLIGRRPWKRPRERNQNFSKVSEYSSEALFFSPSHPCPVTSSPTYPVFLLCLPQEGPESQKEMKLLLDMYKSAPQGTADKVQLMAAERKAKAEVRTGRVCGMCSRLPQGRESGDQS